MKSRKIISGIWTRLIPDYPVNIESVGDRFEWYHRGNMNFKRLIVACSLISLFLSMIGLFAVSYQKTLSRTKEIGIRKINGAGIIEILVLINGDFVRWTIIAFLIAAPAAAYAMYKWLESLCVQDGCNMVDFFSFGSNSTCNFDCDSKLSELEGGDEESG